MSTQQQRAAWRELEAAATPGEWFINFHLNGVKHGLEHVASCGTENFAADAAFIAAARAAVPQLLADVDALQAERDALAAELERVRAQAAQTTDERDEEWATNQLGYQLGL